MSMQSTESANRLMAPPDRPGHGAAAPNPPALGEAPHQTLVPFATLACANRSISCHDMSSRPRRVPAVTPRDYRALAKVRYRIRRFLAFSEQAARAHGIEPRQHQLLLALAGTPDGVEPTIAFCAERLQLAHHSTVELVDRCANAGLVRRSASPTDRRVVRLAVTAKGARILERLSVVHTNELRTVAPALVSALVEVLA